MCEIHRHETEKVQWNVDYLSYYIHKITWCLTTLIKHSTLFQQNTVIEQSFGVPSSQTFG